MQRIKYHYHTKWSKSDRERQISWYPYMRNLKKMIQMNLFTKQTHRLREWTYGYQRGKGGGETGSLGLTCTNCYIQNR